jgi:biotin synthase-related radical SAM superfamily protein
MDQDRVDGFEFDGSGKLSKVPEGKVPLDASQIFQTRGCPDCNRPYYNERPRGPMFNYPRKLDDDESSLAMAEALGYIRG